MPGLTSTVSLPISLSLMLKYHAISILIKVLINILSEIKYETFYLRGTDNILNMAL